MKEVEVLQYGETGAKDFLSGAEVLKDTATLDQEQEQQGQLGQGQEVNCF